MPLPLIHIVRPPRSSPGADTLPPALILLHGVGSDERDLLELADYLDPRLLVISLRAPLSHPPGYGWYPVAFTPERIVFDETAAQTSRDLLLTFLRDAPGALGYNAGRTFLMGFSQGAAMSVYAALTRPKIAAGVIAMSGRLLDRIPDEVADDSTTEMPFCVVHGTADPVIPISEGRRLRDYLAELAAHLFYQEYPMGHSVSAESIADIAAWLTSRLDS